MSVSAQMALIAEQERKRNDPTWKPWVTNLDSAYDAYWASHSPRENQAAHHEILLFGGKDGFGGGGWREVAARWARRFACWVERER